MITPIEMLERIHERRPKIAVLGDVMLDGWWNGSMNRFTREAPAPVIDLGSHEAALGGAANTAATLAGLHADVHMFGAVGDDVSGEQVRSKLAALDIDVSGVCTASGVSTATKVRVCVDTQVLFRLDEGSITDWSDETRADLFTRLESILPEVDALLICDYGSTLFTPDMIAQLDALHRPPLVVVDAHDVHKWRTLRPDLVTPNAKETEQVLGRELGEGHARVAAAHAAADELLEACQADRVIVTLDSAGTVALSESHPPFRTHTLPAPESHTSGAGDVFVASLTTALAAEQDFETSLTFAQYAVDTSVRLPGTCVCTAEDLQEAFETSSAGFQAGEVARMVEERRAQGHRIVFTNGCFDVLHPGHTSYLREASALGEVLIVGVNSDASVRRLKGPDRPVNSAEDRARLLGELSCVDGVIIFEEDSACELIRLLKPDVYVKGGDYTESMIVEADAVRQVGGSIYTVKYVPHHSTTQLLSRIRSNLSAREPERVQGRQ